MLDPYDEKSRNWEHTTPTTYNTHKDLIKPLKSNRYKKTFSTFTFVLFMIYVRTSLKADLDLACPQTNSKP